jgi:hypothetical protein
MCQEVFQASAVGKTVQPIPPTEGGVEAALTGGTASCTIVVVPTFLDDPPDEDLL